MLLNYFKIAWRSLIKDKKYSVINFIGLGIGIASAILIFLFVQHEQSFDRFHEDANKIHRMWVKEFVEGDVFFNTITPLIMGNEARDNFAEVTHMSHFISGSQLIRVGSDVQEENVSFADPDFFEIFDFSLGEGTHSLSDPGEVIITSELANKYFNNRQAIDNTISIFSNNEWRDFRVAGIVEEIPSNSSIRFDILLPYDLYRQGVSEGGQACWTCVFGETYVMLQEGTTGKHMQERSASFFDEKVKDQYEPGKYVVGFQPLTDIHLNNDFPTGIAPVSDARYPYILSGIALLILLLAGINYVSLAIGRTLSRSKEVGIRKVAGAGRRQIMTQYWSEAILTTAIAAILALILTSAALPFFNQLFDLNIVIPYGVDLFLILIASSIVLGVMAAIYPSILLSGFNPIQAITGKLGKRATSKHQILRALVGIQFFMSIVLVVSTLIMKRQIDFMRDKDLGYDKNATLVVSRTDGGSLVEMLEESEKLTRIFQNEIASSANVRSVTASNHALGSIGWMRLGYMEEGTGVFRNFQMNGIDDQFLSSYGIELLSGRNFHGNKELDVNAVLVNEQFLEEFNIDAPESAFLPKPFESFKIVGVVEDFHFAS
ncbi:MAG: ABC transporter permease, partial [Saprospiraceae bacterium]|nr:ABC transporter permease [Saprospiraceae bacterium]